MAILIMSHSDILSYPIFTYGIYPMCLLGYRQISAPFLGGASPDGVRCEVYMESRVPNASFSPRGKADGHGFMSSLLGWPLSKGEMR